MSCQQPEAVCAQYQLANRQDIFEFRHLIRFGREMPLVWAGAERLPAAAAMPEGWDAYFAQRGAPDFDDDFRVALTRQSSLPLTVLLGLYELFGLPDLASRRSLTLHLVGAGPSLEWPPSMVWEEILHLLPNLRKSDSTPCGED
jgi:hypothetical protein